MADLKRRRRSRAIGKYSTGPSGSAGSSPTTRISRPASPSPAKRIALEQLARPSAEASTSNEGQGAGVDESVNNSINPAFAIAAAQGAQNSAKDSGSDLADVAQNEVPSDTNSGNDTSMNTSESAIQEEAQQQRAGKRKISLKNRLQSRRTQATIAFGGAGVTLSVVGLIAFLPNFLIKQMTTKLTRTFMDTSSYAIDQAANNYVKSYVTKVIGPGYGQCGTKVGRNCQNFAPGQSIGGKLYTSWRNNRMEQRIFDKYGLEFELDTTDSRKIKVFKTNANGVRGEIDAFGPNSVTKEVTKLFEAETKMQGVLDRRHIRSLLSRKYNAKKFCLIACGKQDDFVDIKFSALKKLKIKLIARAIEPINSKLSTYLLCFVIQCGNFENEANKAAKEIIERTDQELIKKIAKEIEESGAKNLSQFALQKLGKAVIEKLLTKSAGTAAAEAASTAYTSAIPVVGQIYLGITIADFLDTIDQKLEDGSLSKYLRSVNEEAYANYATSFLTASDDIQSNEASLQDTGAMFNLIKGFSKSRLSQSISNTPQKSVTQCDEVVLRADTDPLVCPEKNVQPTLAIEEIRRNPYVSAFMDVANVYGACVGSDYFGPCIGIRPSTVIRPLLRGVNWVLGKATDLVFDAVKAIPGVGSVIDSATALVQRNLQPLIEGLAKKVFPVALDATAEGGEMFDQVAAGLDVINNNFIRGYEDEDGSLAGLGGKLLSTEESTALRKTIALERKEEIKKKSIFARYFDLDDIDSLASISTVAMAERTFSGEVPAFGVDVGSYADTFAGLLGLQKNADALSSVDRASLFGVSQYGFPVSSTALTVDPSTLTPEVCQQYADAREASKYTNEETGQTEYGEVDPCMLYAVAADTLTKADNLDQAEVPNTPADGSDTLSSGLIKGVPIQVGALNLRANCPVSPTIQQLSVTTDAFFEGTRTPMMLCSVHGVRVNTAYAKNFDELFNAMAAEGYTISGSAGYRDSAGQNSGYGGGSGAGTFATPGFSYHQFGAAVDINCQGGGQSYAIAPTHRGRAGFLKNIAQYPCLNWLASNSKNYGFLLQCVGESSRAGGGEIRRDSGGCEWWHLSPTGG